MSILVGEKVLDMAVGLVTVKIKRMLIKMQKKQLVEEDD